MRGVETHRVVEDVEHPGNPLAHGLGGEVQPLVLPGRVELGEAAGQLADRIFLTDDETYTEDPESIRQQVYKGIEKANAKKKTAVVPDRREAITQAFKQAKKGDTVLLTGIGHQDYRNMGGRKEPWDERDVAKELLDRLFGTRL